MPRCGTHGRAFGLGHGRFLRSALRPGVDIPIQRVTLIRIPSLPADGGLLGLKDYSMRDFSLIFLALGTLSLQWGCSGGKGPDAESDVIADASPGAESVVVQPVGASLETESRPVEPELGSVQDADAASEEPSAVDTNDKMRELLEADLPTDTIGRAETESARAPSGVSAAPNPEASMAPSVDPNPQRDTPVVAPTATGASALLDRAEAYAREKKDYKVVTTLRRVDDAALTPAERARKSTLYQAASEKLASSEKGLASE